MMLYLYDRFGTDFMSALHRDGDDLVIRLEAPLNFDYNKVETGVVTVTVTGNGATQIVTVTEEAPNARVFTGRTKLNTVPGAAVEASYGFGYWGQKATLRF